MSEALSSAIDQALADVNFESADAAPTSAEEGESTTDTEAAETEGTELEQGSGEGEDDAEDTEESDDDSEDDESEDDEDESGVVTLSNDSVVRLLDGTEVKASNLIPKSVFTKFQQENAAVRQELEAELEAAKEPVEFVQNLQQAWNKSESGVIVDLLTSTEDPTLVFSEALVALAGQGKLSPDFLSAFGLEGDALAELKKETSEKSELDALKREVEALKKEKNKGEETSAQDAVTQAFVQQINAEWDAVAAIPEVASMDADQQRNLRRELLEFARDNGGTPLPVAYYAKQGQNAKANAAQAAADAAAKAKKQKARAVTPRASNAPVAKPSYKKGDIHSAIDAAVAAAWAQSES